MKDCCENCRYWDNDKNRKYHNDSRQCLNALEDFDKNTPNDHPMTTCDGSQYMAILRTMPDHYCNCWKPLDRNKNE